MTIADIHGASQPLPEDADHSSVGGSEKPSAQAGQADFGSIVLQQAVLVPERTESMHSRQTSTDGTPLLKLLVTSSAEGTKGLIGVPKLLHSCS